MILEQLDIHRPIKINFHLNLTIIQKLIQLYLQNWHNRQIISSQKTLKNSKKKLSKSTLLKFKNTVKSFRARSECQNKKKINKIGIVYKVLFVLALTPSTFGSHLKYSSPCSQFRTLLLGSGGNRSIL